MDEAITHFKVPVEREDRDACLGPDGSVTHVARVLRMISGRWKLPILFRLFAEPSIRTSQFLRDIPDISQKMLTQHLRELEATRVGLLDRLPVSLSARLDRACVESSLPESVIAALLGVTAAELWDIRNRGLIPPGALPRVRAFADLAAETTGEQQ